MRYISLHSIERIASVLVVAAIACVVADSRTWMALVISAATGHYLLSVGYSRKQIAQVCSRPGPLAGFLALILAGIFLYRGGFPLIVIFGIHHVFNEVYLLDRTLKLRDRGEAAFFRTSSILVNFSLYFATVRSYEELHWINHMFLFASVAVTCVLFLVALTRVRQVVEPSRILDCVIFEVVGLALLAVSFYRPINVFHVVLYHCVFWGVYPLQKMARQGAGEVGRYLGQNAVSIGAAFLVSPLAFVAVHFSDANWDAFFRFSSWLHIMMAFGLSTAHPAWITRLFQAGPPAGSAPTTT